MRKLSARETVLELLRTYQDVVCPLTDQGGAGGKPSSRLLARDGRHWYFVGSYRTLEEILRHMRAGGGLEGGERYKLAIAYWAVAESFIRCERRMVEREVRRKARNHKWVTVTERFTEPVRNGAVRDEDLDAGVDWITAEFARRGVSPFLPVEFLEVVAA